MADHNLPTTSSLYTDVIAQLMARIDESLMLLSVGDASPTNMPTGSLRRNGLNVERWSGTAWAAIARMLSTDNATALTALGVSAFIRQLLDDTDASAARATLGAQASDATLTALAAITTAANKLIYATGSDAFSTTDFTAFARTLLDDADAATARTTLGLTIGTNVQAYDATLAVLAGLALAADKMIYATGSDQVATTTLTAFARTLLDDADAASARATLGAAPLASPALTGTPTTTTPTDGDNSTKIASTAFVQSTVGGYLPITMTSADVTLTDAQASNPIIRVSGALTANVNLIIPVSAKRIYGVRNDTTGAFTLTVKTPAGAGVTIAQGKRNLVYSDGTNMADAFTDFESIALTGNPTAPTQGITDNSTKIATTQYVQSAIIPKTSVMLFIQASAPVGWTKLTTHDNKALRIVSGTGGGSGGTVAFTTAFASKSVAGTISSTTATGTINSTTATGSITGAVSATTLTTTQMPAHTHGQRVYAAISYSGDKPIGFSNTAESPTYTYQTASEGGGGSHTHGDTFAFAGTSHGHTFTGTSHGHTFTGTDIDIDVLHVDAIICQRN